MEQEEDIKLSVYRDMLDQIGAGATAGGVVAQTAFTQFYCDFLSDEAKFSSPLIPTYFCKEWGASEDGDKRGRVDAYYLDNQTYDLTLVVSDFSIADKPETINTEDIRTRFKMVRRFFRACGSQEFRQSIEDSEDVMELVHLIRENIRLISRVRYILITNKTLGVRVKDSVFSDLSKEDGSIKSDYVSWDFQRYYKTKILPDPEIEVDCCKYSPDNKGLSFLFSDSVGRKIGPEEGREYSAYLVMLPGRMVRDWYATYADRLLEQNVRTFLQFRGKINRGIRETLHGEPHRFFAYNNGLTATADSVELDEEKLRIKSIKNLQIVNGGQTTASIYTAFAKNDKDIDQIVVQMKLIVSSGPRFEKLVNNISQYANSQNKISKTAFASNSRFMQRMQGFSRSLTANPGGSQRGVRWFFERVNGQYLNSINLLSTESEKKSFIALYPKSHVITKTDMAKYILSWDMVPWIVAKGGESAFFEFETKRRFGSEGDGVSTLPGKEMIARWRDNDADDNPQFCRYYYYELVGKAILYRELDRLLRKCDWCKGYKSQIICYTMSVAHYIISHSKKVFNFYYVWNSQMVSMEWLDYLSGLANRVQEIMIRTAEGRNVSQWAKSCELWVKIKCDFIREVLPAQLLNSSFVMDVDLLATARETSAREQTRANGNDLVHRVIKTENRLWDELKVWLASSSLKYSQAQIEALNTRLFYCHRVDVIAAKKLLKLWQQAAKEGFPHPPIDDE